MDPYSGLSLFLGNIYTFLSIVGELFGIILGVGNYLINTLIPFYQSLIPPTASA